MTSRVVHVLAPWLLVLCSCDALEPESCTLIGCSDGLSLRAKTASGGLTDGTYSIALRLDGTAIQCTLDASDLSTRSAQTYLTAECDDRTSSVTLSAPTECTEHRSEEAVGQSCQPIAGKWQLDIGVQGIPASVQLEIARDGVTVLEQTLAPTYLDTRPNGPKCEPLCRQASEELTLQGD